MKKLLIILLELCCVIGVVAQTENSPKKKGKLSFGRMFSKQKRQNQEPKEPEIKYYPDSLKNGAVILFPHNEDNRAAGYDSLKYVYPDQSEINIYPIYDGIGNRLGFNIYKEHDNLAKIVYPDGSYYAGLFYIDRESGNIRLHWNFAGNKGLMAYKNGDLLFYNGSDDRVLFGIKLTAELMPQHFIVDNYDFFYPFYQQFENGTGFSEFLNFDRSSIVQAYVPSNIKSICGDEMFWETGSYPSVVIKENIKLIHEYINTYEENKTKQQEQLKSIPLNKYSGRFPIEGISMAGNAEYTYKEIDGVRYKDGNIKCMFPNGFNLTGQYVLGERSGLWILQGKDGQLIKGEYNNNRRIGKWVYKGISYKGDRSKVVVESEANFHDGILVDNFMYCKVDEFTGVKLIVNGQFTSDGVIDGDWCIKRIMMEGDEIVEEILQTCTYEDGYLVSIETKNLNTGGIIKLTKNGIEFKNIQERSDGLQSLKNRFNHYSTLRAIDFTIRNYTKPIEYEYLSIWLEPLWKMSNPIDNEFNCKYYSKNIN